MPRVREISVTSWPQDLSILKTHNFKTSFLRFLFLFRALRVLRGSCFFISCLSLGSCFLFVLFVSFVVPVFLLRVFRVFRGSCFSFVCFVFIRVHSCPFAVPVFILCVSWFLFFIRVYPLVPVFYSCPFVSIRGSSFCFVLFVSFVVPVFLLRVHSRSFAVPVAPSRIPRQ